MSKVRLLKVIVQPVVAIDDGEYLTERVINARTVNAADWEEFLKAGFGDEFDEFCKRIEEG